ncbi:MAG: serine hydrolase domain-containing protein [Telluria sp.]|nr:serine hydrolase domain-containing protein [Telluria sp.]
MRLLLSSTFKVLAFLALLVCSVPFGALAQTPATSQAPSSSDLQRFMDAYVPAQLKRKHIAGAVVTVVKDGELIFSRGYGFADVGKASPMQPDAALLRPGSISKLLTLIAVMQQVEQGKLDLDRDVNAYLDFKVPTPTRGVRQRWRRWAEKCTE